MSSSADDAREVIKEERKGLIEINLKWLFCLADWIFSEPPRGTLLEKTKKKQSDSKQNHK